MARRAESRWHQFADDSRALLSPVPPGTNPTSLGPPCAADIVGEYQGLWRGSYPAGFHYDVAWTCGTSSTDRTILRAGVQ